MTKGATVADSFVFAPPNAMKARNHGAKVAECLYGAQDALQLYPPSIELKSSPKPFRC
jgi:hypothetical protein